MERKIFTNIKQEEFSFLFYSQSASVPFNVLFFHATGFNAQTYNILFKSLMNKFDGELNILALDQRGHGKSTAESNSQELKSWYVYLEDALEFSNQISGPIICIGHSMGAIVAARLVELRQNKDDSLVMIEPVLAGPYESLKYRIFSKLNIKRRISIAEDAAKRRSTFKSTKEAINSYVGRGAFSSWGKPWIEDYVWGGTRKLKGGDVELTCSPEWERKTFLTSAFDSWGYLKKINIPVLVLSGTINSTFSEQARDSLSKLGKSWILESFSGSSHFLPMESTQQVVDRIYKFVSK